MIKNLLTSLRHKKISALSSALPELMLEARAALDSEGRGDLLPQLMAGEIMRCTYDAKADAGYIYMARPKPSVQFANLAAPVAETLAFVEGFNIDVDHDGHIFGIEILSRSDIFASLKKANQL